MNLNRTTKILLILFLAFFAVTGTVIAKSKSKSSWSSSKSSYKPKKPAFSRKSTLPKTYSASKAKAKPNTSTTSVENTTNTTKKTTSNTVSSKPTNQSSNTKQKNKALEIAASNTNRKKIEAENKKIIATKPLKTLRNERRQYNTDPSYNRIRVVNHHTYASNRNRYYSNNSYRPGVWVSSSRYQNYGVWDSAFMWNMSANINSPRYANTYYHNRNTASYRQWRKEANLLARENAELQGQLNAMDLKISSMSGEIKPGYIDKEIPQEVWATEDAATTPDTSEFKFGVGSKSGMYQKGCDELIYTDDENSVNFNCLNLAGSFDIMEKIISGELDGGFVQSDIIDFFKDKLHHFDALQAPAYKELGFLVTAIDSDINGIKDLSNTPENTLYSIGDGARYTMKNFAKLDSSYRDAAEKAFKNKLPAQLKSFELISKKKNAAVIMFCAVNCPLLKDLNDSEFASKVRLVPINDWDFDDKYDSYGNKIYTFEKISADQFEGLIPDGFFDSGKIETISVTAVLFASQKWIEAKGDDAGLMLDFMLTNALPEIQRLAGKPL